MNLDYLNSAQKQFEYYKMLGEKAIAQIPDNKLGWQFNEESNSIATIVKHLHGNMLSRWTDFLTTDGEKESRNRDAEFQEKGSASREAVMKLWEEGWNCLFRALQGLTEEDLSKTVYIRHQGHTVVEAINRQLAHYPYHVGQIIFIGKMVCDQPWVSLSIPRGHSNQYNTDKFAQPKRAEHFTEEFLKGNQSAS